MEVLDSPVPALVGVQAPFKLPLLGGPLGFAVDGIVVLDLDARPASVRENLEKGEQREGWFDWFLLFFSQY